MKLEPTIYVLDSTKYDTSELTNEEFIDSAEFGGKVYSLSGFQEAFNLEEILTSFDVIRIIWRKTSDNMFGVEVSNYTNSEKLIDDLPII